MDAETNPIANASYKPILDMLSESSKASDAGATVAALAMVYIGIDTFAWLALPAGKERQTRADFCEWVDTYLKADTSEAYQYVGLDLYAARCAVLHTFATLSDLHSKNRYLKRFAYTDNGQHRSNGGDLVIISVAVLLKDFGLAAERFLRAVASDASLKSRVDSRIGTLLNSTPLQMSANESDLIESEQLQ